MDFALTNSFIVGDQVELSIIQAKKRDEQASQKLWANASSKAFTIKYHHKAERIPSGLTFSSSKMHFSKSFLRADSFFSTLKSQLNSSVVDSGAGRTGMSRGAVHSSEVFDSWDLMGAIRCVSNTVAAASLIDFWKKDRSSWRITRLTGGWNIMALIVTLRDNQPVCGYIDALRGKDNNIGKGTEK